MPRFRYEKDHWKILRLRGVSAIVDIIGVFALGDICNFVGLRPWSVHPRADENGAHGLTVHPAGLVVWAVLTLAWYVVPEATFGGTAGKRLMGLRVCSSRGPVTFTQVLVRNVFRVMDFPLLYAIGGLVSAISPQGQRIGDLIANTRVELADQAQSS